MSTNNSDLTDNMASDQDLLDLLTGGDTSSDASSGDNNQSSQLSDLEKALSDTESDVSTSKHLSEEDKKMEELRNLANSMQNSIDNLDNGSGDLATDLANWFDGVSSLPSTPLTHYVANPVMKMDYALTSGVLNNYKIIDKLRKFIEEDAFDSLFSEAAIMGLDAHDLEARIRLAADIYVRLSSYNAKVLFDTKQMRLKSNESEDEFDRLQMLISSIPSEKLEALLKEIALKDKE